MQWRKRDGSTGEYVGPLIELGQGIPRPMRDHGLRRAIFDLAFGYVSGFPLRDILPFAFRSLFPQPIYSAEEVEFEEVDSLHVGTVRLACPVCGETSPASVSAVIEGEPGSEHLVCTPDMSDVWAHAWTHED